MYLKFPLFSFLILILTNNCTSQKDNRECIAEYLLLGKNYPTEIFAYKHKKNWVVKRRIRMDLVKDLTISREDMEEVMDKEFTKKCFKKNNHFWNRKDPIHIGKKNKENFIFSDEYQDLLNEQSICCANFFYKDENYRRSYLKGEYNILLTDTEEAAIDYFKAISYNSYKYLYKFEFDVEDTFDINYKKDTEEYKQVENCYKIIEEKPNQNIQNTNVASSSTNPNTRVYTTIGNDEYISLKAVCNRFNIKQFYMGFIPGIKYSNVIKIDEDGKECSVCHGIFKIGDEADEVFNCKHIFHERCIQKVFFGGGANNNRCPFCRGFIF